MVFSKISVTDILCIYLENEMFIPGFLPAVEKTKHGTTEVWRQRCT